MDVGGDLTLQWVEEVGNVIHEEVICGLEAELDAPVEEVVGACEEVTAEETVQDNSVQHNSHITDSEIMMVPQTSDIESIYVIPQDQGHDYLNIQVTEEEVITHNWDRTEPNDGMDVPETKVPHENLIEYDDMEIPLPIDQDSYTNTRPHPCDFCSKRFRKKANYLAHMLTHQNDRLQSCNLCGMKFPKKTDLNNHLKTHAYAPLRTGLEDDLEDPLATEDEDNQAPRGRKKKVNSTPKKRRAPAPKRTANDDAIRWSHQSGVNQHPLSPRYPVIDSTKPYVCQTCGISFAREKALASHARIHGGDSPLECISCNELFWDMNSLQEHNRTKHNGGMIQLVQQMPESVPTYEENDGFGEYTCETCGIPFHRLDLLKRHRKIHIKQEVETMDSSQQQHHVCNVCGEWFEEALALLAHAESHASRSPSRRCLLCGERCRDDTELADHVRQMHAEDAPPNTCVQCGKTCKDKRSLLKHSWIHNTDKTFGCTKCGKRFHSKARLRRHMVSHRNKMVACDECGEEFPDGRALVSHRHSHNKELGGRTFPCRECGKTFGSRSSQQIHIRIHTGERPYGCRYCWKAFADGGTLRKHERIHTGEKPYACAICPRAFNQRVVLREHVRAHHSLPDPKCQNSLKPYLCKVCNETFSTNDEIIAHIVAHCDEATALKRQPQNGPRKYKRRRKLKNEDGTETFETVSDNVPFEFDDASKRPKIPRKTPIKQEKRQTSVQEGYQNVLKSFESSLQNLNSIVNSTKSSSKAKAPKKKSKKENQKAVSNNNPVLLPVDPVASSHAGRPKMIHTQKTRVPVEIGTDGVKKGQKTKTMVMRTPKEPQYHMLSLPMQTIQQQPIQQIITRPPPSLTGERNRPRTKNVSYHVEGRQSFVAATFPPKAISLEEHPPPVATEVQISTEPEEHHPPLEMVNVKMEPDYNKMMNLMDNQPDNNVHEEIVSNGELSHDFGNASFSTPKVSSPRKRGPVKRTKRRQCAANARKAREQKNTSASMVQESALLMENNTNMSMSEEQLENVQVEHEDSILLKSNLEHNVTVKDVTPNRPPQQLFESPVDGNNLDVAYEASVVADETEHIEPESILSDYDTTNHIKDAEVPDNVKLSVTVESAHQGMLVHNLIRSVEESVPETIIPDAVLYTCEMCSAVFSTRNELLVHVPVHI
ncbi:hypothetical protein TKK_0012162 [Trichogramma kaykai]|uniref:C2H2-type domain-containing protein n=1 Tax=Trichogramma kaykai TaxID=54128 RepID=A0ABD2WMG4_9HYME